MGKYQFEDCEGDKGGEKLCEIVQDQVKFGSLKSYGSLCS